MANNTLVLLAFLFRVIYKLCIHIKERTLATSTHSILFRCDSLPACARGIIKRLGLVAVALVLPALAHAQVLSPTLEVMSPVLQQRTDANVNQNQYIGGNGAKTQAQQPPSETPAATTGPAAAYSLPQPFGASLFQGQFSASAAISIRPNYEIQPGDQVAIVIWGAQTFDSVQNVDSQGNIFLPEIGPIPVGGLRNNQLNNQVRTYVRNVFTKNVNVYTNLLGAQPISVFVTGQVAKPGQYLGDNTDTLIYFIDRAGGIDPLGGSYRNIQVLRAGKVVANADLYQFLLSGILPKVQFEDGDTIVVGPRGAALTVSGEAQNAYIFEFDPQTTKGLNIIQIAKPTPRASHVLVQGVRNDEAYSGYLTNRQFEQARLQDGDTVQFVGDRIDNTIIINVEGQSNGTSIFLVRRGGRLSEVLDLIEVDPGVANIQAIFIKRKSVADAQEKAIEQALQELQKSVLTATSQSQSEAGIRIQEATLVERFVKRARNVKPEGRIVLASTNNLRDVRLEAGDQIVIPQASDVVLISGEVTIPQSIIWNEGLSIDDYVSAAGGYSERADDGNILIIRQSGEVFREGEQPIRSGDHLMVFPRVDSKNLATFKDVVQVLYQIAVASSVLIRVW